MFLKREIKKIIKIKCHLYSPVTKTWRQRCQRGTKARRTSGPGSKLSGSVCRKLNEVGAVNTCPVHHFSTQPSRPYTTAWHSYRFSASVCAGCTVGQPVTWVVKVSEERELDPCCVWRGWARLLVSVCVLQAPRARADALLLCAVRSPSAVWNLYQTCFSKGAYRAALAIMYTKVSWGYGSCWHCFAVRPGRDSSLMWHLRNSSPNRTAAVRLSEQIETFFKILF